MKKQKVYRQAHEMDDPPQKKVTMDGMLAWHRALALITGGLTLRIEKRSVAKTDLVAWADSLELVAKQLREAAK